MGEARLTLSHPLPRPAPASTSAGAPSSVRTGWSLPPTVGSGEAPLHLLKGTTFTSQPQAGSGSGHGAAGGGGGGCQGAGGGCSCSPPAGRTVSRKSRPPSPNRCQHPGLQTPAWSRIACLGLRLHSTAGETEAQGEQGCPGVPARLLSLGGLAHLAQCPGLCGGSCEPVLRLWLPF